MLRVERYYIYYILAAEQQMFDKSRSLVYELTNEIGFSIVNGDFSASDKFLTENEISDKYGVSRNIVRESVKVLHAKGLLESNARTGIKLTSSECWSLYDSTVLKWIQNSKAKYEFLIELIDLLKAVEPEAARLAAHNYKNAEKINAISMALQQIESSVLGCDSLMRAEIDFHIAILRSSNNAYFIQMHKIVEVAIKLRHSFLDQSASTVKLGYHYYRMIFEAIKLGDAELSSLLTLGLIKEFLGMINSAEPKLSNIQNISFQRDRFFAQSA